MRTDARTFIWIGLALYGLVLGIPTAIRYARRRRAFRFFVDHPDLAAMEGIAPVTLDGPRAVVSKALFWGEAIRVAIQAGFLIIGAGALWPHLFGVHFGVVFADALIASSALLNAQAHISRWMYRRVRVDEGKGVKKMDVNHLKDTVKRVVWTFVEAFLATFAVMAPGALMAPNLNEGKALAIAAVTGAIAAGVSAVKNLATKPGSTIR